MNYSGPGIRAAWQYDRTVHGPPLRVTLQFRRAEVASSPHCVAIAIRARASYCSSSSLKVASLISTITRRIVPVKANGDSYRSETGEQVSQPTSNVSFAVK